MASIIFQRKIFLSKSLDVKSVDISKVEVDEFLTMSSRTMKLMLP